MQRPQSDNQLADRRGGLQVKSAPQVFRATGISDYLGPAGKAREPKPLLRMKAPRTTKLNVRTGDGITFTFDAGQADYDLRLAGECYLAVWPFQGGCKPLVTCPASALPLIRATDLDSEAVM
jgi:hypothetical protein